MLPVNTPLVLQMITKLQNLLLLFHALQLSAGSSQYFIEVWFFLTKSIK